MAYKCQLKGVLLTNWVSGDVGFCIVTYIRTSDLEVAAKIAGLVTKTGIISI